jgi:hypothetical protein
MVTLQTVTDTSILDTMSTPGPVFVDIGSISPSSSISPVELTTTRMVMTEVTPVKVDSIIMNTVDVITPEELKYQIFDPNQENRQLTDALSISEHQAADDLARIEREATSYNNTTIPQSSIPMSPIVIQNPDDASPESDRLADAQKNTDNFNTMNVGKYQLDAVQGKSIDMPSEAPAAPASILAPSPPAVQRQYEPIRQSSSAAAGTSNNLVFNKPPESKIVTETSKQDDIKGQPEPKIRMMMAGDDIGSKTASVFSAIGAVISAIIAIANLQGDVDFYNVIFFAGFTFLTVYLVRQSIYHSAISKAIIRQINTAMPGRIMKIEIDLGIMKSIPINQIKLTVSLNEIVAKQENNKKSTQTFLRYTRDVMLIPSPVVWARQTYVTLTAWVELPKDAEGSFKSEFNQLAWTAELYGEIPGWYPDIRMHVPLQVLPIIERKPAPTETKSVALDNLRGLNAVMTMDAPIDTHGRITIPMGREIPYTVQINPTNSGPHRKLFLEITMLVKGAGTPENKVIHRQILFGNGWEARQKLEKTGTFTLPIQAVYSSNVDAGGVLPISYTGKYLTIEWQAVVREEIPWEKHPTDFVPIIVVPAEKYLQGGN